MKDVPVTHTFDDINTTVNRVSENKVVVKHEKYHDPITGEKYLDWKRTETIVRNSGNVVVNQVTETYIPHTDTWREEHDFTHSFELTDDNETLAHNGKLWDTHYIEQSRKCANLRWACLDRNKTSAKEVVKEKIEAQL